MDEWMKMLYVNKNLITSNNQSLSLKLRENNTLFAKDILLCVERLVSENINVKGWELYSNPRGNTYCFRRKSTGNGWIYLDFEIGINNAFFTKRYAVPCITISKSLVYFNSIREIFFYKMHLRHDSGRQFFDDL